MELRTNKLRWREYMLFSLYIKKIHIKKTSQPYPTNNPIWLDPNPTWAACLPSLDSIGPIGDKFYQIGGLYIYIYIFTHIYILMRYDFINLMEGAQACPTPCLRAWVSEEPDPLGMVTSVMPATTPPTLKLEQGNIIYQDKRWQ